MNEKGRQTKLLAAIAVLAMVICAFAVVMPSDNVDAVPDVTQVGYNNGTAETDAGNYYVAIDEDTGNVDAKFQLSSGTSNIYIEAGAQVTLNITSTAIVNLYIADSWVANEVSEDNESEAVTGTVTPVANSMVQFDAGSSAAETTVTAVDVGKAGFRIASADITGNKIAVNSVAFTIANNTNTTYYNIGQLTGNIDLVSGETLTIPTSVAESTGVEAVTVGGTFSVRGIVVGSDASAIVTSQVNFNDLVMGTTASGEITVEATAGTAVGSVTPAELAIGGGDKTVTGTITVTPISTSSTPANDAGKKAIELDSFAATQCLQGFSQGTPANLANSIADLDAAVDNILDDNGNLVASITGYGRITSLPTIIGNSTPVTFSLGSETSSFQGTVVYKDNATAASVQITQTITLSASGACTSLLSAGATGITITGTATTLTSGTSTFATDSNVTISAASQTLAGAAAEANSTVITVSGVALNGNLSAPLTLDGAAVVPENATLTFMTGGKITTAASSKDLTVLGDLRYGNGVTVGGQIDNTAGKVFTNDRSMVDPYVTDTDNVTPIDGVVYVDSAFFDGADIEANTEKFLSLIASGVPFQLSNSDVDEFTILNIMTSVDISNTTVYMPGGSMIVVGGDTAALSTEYSTGYKVQQIGTGTRGTLSITNTTINSDAATGGHAAAGKDSIVVNERNGLNIVNSYIFAVVDVDNRASVSINNNEVRYDYTTDSASVGYGTTLNLTGTVAGDVTVYGNLVINTDVDIPYGKQINAYKGSSITVNGTLDIAGQANFYDGSTTTINGTVTIYRDVGGATMTVGKDPYNVAVAGADIIIGAEGTMNVRAAGNGYAGENVLTVNNPAAQFTGSWTPRFLVQGTLNVNGTLAGNGQVHDMGTVTFNGKSAVDSTGAYPDIVVYNGITLTVSSVNGTLGVTDAGIASESVYGRDNREASTGNTVTLTNVRNVTVAVTLNDVRWTDSNDDNHIDYVSVMDVSGTVTSTDDDNGTSGAYYSTVGFDSPVATDSFTGVGKYNNTLANIQVSGTLSLGRNVQLNVTAGETVVSGEVSSMSKEGNNGGQQSSITNAGEITVTGTMYGYDGSITSTGTVNAAFYQVTGTGEDSDTVDYYTGFNAAITAGPEADDGVTIYGTVSATETITIPAGLTVTMETGSELIVGSDITVTLANGANLEGLSATITVSGTFIAENYNQDMSVTNVVSDVVIDETPKMTWTSLANAIGMGMTEIILNGPLHITEDLEIPAGVTVSTNYEVDIDAEPEESYAIFVDDAALTVNGTLYMGEKTEGRIIFSTDAEMSVSGTFHARLMVDEFDTAESTPEIYNLYGAHYTIIEGAYDNYYVSSIAIAAENVSENVNFDESRGVIIKGVLTAGDVAFTAAPDMTIDIKIESLGDGADQVTVLRLGTVNVENVNITIGDNCRVSGTIASATASVALTNAGNVTIVSTDGEESETEVSGAFTGTVEIATGEVSIDTSLTVGAESVLNVASGAVLNVPASTYLSVAASEDDNAVIDGTINFTPADGLRGTGILLVNGTANVGAFTLDTDMRVTGQLNIADGKVLTINGADLFLGEKPETLGQTATGAVDGAIVFTPGCVYAIVAYNGADLSGAQIQINSATGESEAAVTTYNVNGTAYMTVYAYEDVLSIINGSAVDGAIDLIGWQAAGHWYAVQDYNTTTDKNVDTDYVGEHANVYTTLAAENVPGIISKDAGIILTIDDLVVGTIGDVAQTIEDHPLSVGTHTIAWSERTGYNIENVTVTFNGETVTNGGTITVTADMESYIIIAQGAVPGAAPGGDSGSSTSGDDGMGLTDYLLIVLVILIVVMAIMVAVRLMRS